MRPLLKALIQLLGQPDHVDRKWANFDCPFCGGRRKFGVNVGALRTKCFKCGSSPPVLRLWKIHGQTVPVFLRDLVHRPAKVSPLRAPDDEFSTVPLDDWTRLPNDDMDPLDEAALEYAVERGADPKVWEFGTIDDEHAGGRVVFLLRDCGLAVSYQARAIDRSGFPKTLNPPEGVGTPKSKLLFGGEHVMPGEEIVVCEGVFDAVSISNTGRRAVGLLGKSPSRDQIRLLQAHDGPIVLMLDRKTGDEVAKIGRALLDAERTFHVFDWRKVDGDDPGELEPEEIDGAMRHLIGVDSLTRLRLATAHEMPSRRDSPLQRSRRRKLPRVSLSGDRKGKWRR